MRVAIGLGLAGMVGPWWWLPLLSLPLAIWLVRFVEPDRGPTAESGAQTHGSTAPAVRAAVRGRPVAGLDADAFPTGCGSARTSRPSAARWLCGKRRGRLPSSTRRVDAAAARCATRRSAGERVGIRAANSAGFVVAVHALMRLGAVLVPINTRLTEPEVAWQLADADVSHVLGRGELDALLDCAPHAPGAERDFDLEAWHSIVYTSGTTRPAQRRHPDLRQPLVERGRLGAEPRACCPTTAGWPACRCSTSAGCRSCCAASSTA